MSRRARSGEFPRGTFPGVASPRDKLLLLRFWSGWEAVVLAAGLVLGVVALCEELSCPDACVGVVVAAADAFPDVAGLIPVTVVGGVVVVDDDVPGSVVVEVVL